MFPRIVAWFLVASVLSGAELAASADSGAVGNLDRQPEAEALPKGAVARLGTSRFRHWQSISATAFSPEGDFLATADCSDVVRVWQVTSGKAIVSFPIRGSHGLRNPIRSLKFSSDGKRLAAGAANGVWVWDWRKDLKARLLIPSIVIEEAPFHEKKLVGIRSIDFSPDGRILGCCDNDGSVRLWYVKTENELLCLPGEKDPDRVNWRNYPMTFSPTGGIMAFPSLRYDIRICTVENGKELMRLRGHGGPICSLCFSPDGKTLGSASEDGRLCLWKVSTGKETAHFQQGKAGHNALVFSPNGNLCICGDAEGRIRIRETSSGKVVRELQGRSSGISCLAISPDGKTLVAGGEDEALWRWDLEMGKELPYEAGHRARVEAVAFSPDGKMLVTGSADGTSRLWEVRSGKQVACYVGNTQKVYGVAYSPDGGTVAAASDQGEEGLVRLWRNWRLGRANRAGAWRLGVFVLATQMLAWVFLAHHTPSFGDEYFGLFAPMLGRAITAVGFVVLIYLALEPLVRRRWPWRIVGWNRVLEGRFRDPLVGRDLLVGVLCGAGFLILDQVRVLTSSWLGMAMASPQQPYEVIFASNVPGMVCMWSGLVMPAMAYLFLLLILVTVCRREWLGNVAWVLLWPTLDALSGELSAINVVCVIVSYALQLMLLLRAGFLAFTVSLISFLILFHIPLTLDLSAWYAPTGLTYLLVPATVAVYGCVISMGRGQLFATEATAKV